MRRIILFIAIGALAIPVTAAAAPPAAIRVPLVAVCHGSAALARAALAQGVSTPRQLEAFCARHGTPAAPSAHVANTYCGNVGCAWIVLYNEGNGFGFSEYGADPYYSGIAYGAAAVHTYNARTRVSSGWSEAVDSDCGTGNWCGYHSQHPSYGTVYDTLSGWCYLRNGVFAQIGPVTAVAKITS